MTGYIHDPLQIINLIADNIRDRYKSGFSVIKEIIQNADDAGGGNSDSGLTVGEGESDGRGGNGSGDSKDVSFEFGLSPGLKGADHPLLKGPALFFFNNGRFTQSDAVAIRSFGLNRKAVDEATIGKFGLGMKSVFHFCEAFFFLAQNKYRSYAEILNPWSGPAEFQSLHSDWDAFSDRDAEILKNHLAEVIGPYGEKSNSWFLLWLPLRSRHHLKSDGQEVGSIVAEFPGDDLSRLEFLRDHKMPRRLGRLLPLLRRIVSIRFWEFNIETGHFPSAYRLFLKTPSSRTQFPGKPKPSFSGQIQCENGPGLHGSHWLSYAGLERQVDAHGLKELTASEFWPRSYVRDENGQSLQAPDKARAHCAAVFSACEDSDKPGLDIRWAVFLPIETGRESISCDGNQSFCLTLHGYFFVDAGRAEVTGLLPSNLPSCELAPANEDELRHHWNKCLSERGTLSLVIPALVEFGKHRGINRKEIDNLCKVLSISKTFCQNRHAICCSYQFVFRLRIDRSGWAIVRKDALLLPLPAPPETDPSRPWSTFRYLNGVEGGPQFIQDDASHLLATADAPVWDESLLEKVLDIDVSTVFNNTGQLNYLCLFLSREYVRRFVGRGSVQSRLKSILRTALRTYGQKLTQHRSRFQEVAALVLADYRLPIIASWSTVLVTLLQCQTSVLMVPREMDSPDFPGQAKLGVEDAVSWLRKIDELVRASMQNTEILNECRQLSRQVIENIQAELLPEVLKLVALEKIIDAFDCKRKSRVLLSIEELLSCQERGLLFLFSQGTTDEQRVYLAPALQQAIHDRVLLISTKYAQLISAHSMDFCRAIRKDVCKHWEYHHLH
jgi:hypothetical protein